MLKSRADQREHLETRFAALLPLGEMEGPDWRVVVVNAEDVGLFIAVRRLEDGTVQDVTAYGSGLTSYMRTTPDEVLISHAQGDVERVLQAIRDDVTGDEDEGQGLGSPR